MDVDADLYPYEFRFTAPEFEFEPAMLTLPGGIDDRTDSFVPETLLAVMGPEEGVAPVLEAPPSKPAVVPPAVKLSVTAVKESAHPFVATVSPPPRGGGGVFPHEKAIVIRTAGHGAPSPVTATVLAGRFAPSLAAPVPAAAVHLAQPADCGSWRSVCTEDDPAERDAEDDEATVRDLTTELFNDVGGMRHASFKKVPRGCEHKVARLREAVYRAVPGGRGCPVSAFWTRLSKMFVLARQLGVGPASITPFVHGINKRMVFCLRVPETLGEQAWRAMFGDNPARKVRPRGPFSVAYWPHTNGFIVLR